MDHTFYPLLLFLLLLLLLLLSITVIIYYKEYKTKIGTNNIINNNKK